MVKSKFQYTSYWYDIIIHFSNSETIMLFFIKFPADFFNFTIDPKLDKYLINVFDLHLSARQDEIPRLKIKNENQKNIKNLLDFT